MLGIFQKYIFSSHPLLWCNVLLSLAMLWQVTEQDIFWQIRAGQELWQKLEFPTIETWSYTVHGSPWFNVQWLSTLLFYAIYQIAQEPSLVCFRAILGGVLFFLLGCMFKKTPPIQQHFLWQCIVCLIYFNILYPRLQLRADFLVLLFFTFIEWLWLVKPWSLTFSRWLSLAILCLVANLHIGVAPFVALQVFYHLQQQTSHETFFSIRSQCLRLLAIALSLCLTPYHIKAFPWVWQHVHYYSNQLLQNPDHQALSWSYFQISHQGLGPWFWLFVNGLWLMLWFEQSFMTCLSSSATSKSKQLCQFLCYLVFTAVSIDRVRAIPYQSIFLLPDLKRWSEHSRFFYLQKWWQFQLLGIGILALSSTIYLSIKHAEHFGFSSNRAVFPVDASAFIKAHGIQGPLLHTFAFGAYTVWANQELPVYVDTRETMFWPLQQEILASYHHPAASQMLYEKYQITALLMPIPNTAYIKDLGFRDILAEHAPVEQWALVYFDQVAVVMLKRIPPHQKIIEEHEYKLLRPHIPANLYAVLHNDSQKDLLFEKELMRCRQESPYSAYCMMAESAWWRVQRDPNYPLNSIPQLKKAIRMLPTNLKSQQLTALLELQYAQRDRFKHFD